MKTKSKINFDGSPKVRPMLTHTDEFAIRVDLNSIEQKLSSIKWAVTDCRAGNPSEIIAKINAVRAQLNEIENKLKPSQWQCPACRKTYATYAEAKCCREIPVQIYQEGK